MYLILLLLRSWVLSDVEQTNWDRGHAELIGPRDLLLFFYFILVFCLFPSPPLIFRGESRGGGHFPPIKCLLKEETVQTTEFRETQRQKPWKQSWSFRRLTSNRTALALCDGVGGGAAEAQWAWQVGTWQNRGWLAQYAAGAGARHTISWCTVAPNG